MDDIFSIKHLDAADEQRITNPIDLGNYEQGADGSLTPKAGSNPQHTSSFPVQTPNQIVPVGNEGGGGGASGYSNNQIATTNPEGGGACKLCRVM